MVLVGFRTGIGYLGLSSTLNWGRLRKTDTAKSLQCAPSSRPSPHEADHKTSCEQCPPYTRRNGTPLSLKTKWCWKEPKKKQVLLHFPQIITLISPSLTCHSPLRLSLLNKPSIKILRSVSQVFISLWRHLHHVKLVLSRCVSFSPANPSLSV